MELPAVLREGGPVMPLILLAALAGLVMSAERLLVWAWWLYRDRGLNRAEDAPALRAGLLDAALNARPTPMRWLLRHTEPFRALPPDQREPAVQAKLLACLPEVGARISTIGWLGGVLPMLGLLGTVSGMIFTFKSLATTVSRQVLSLGLAEALWTTEAGLLGALPLLAAHHVLTRLKSNWLIHVERCLALQTQEAYGAPPAVQPAVLTAGQPTTQPARRVAPSEEAHEA